MFLSSQLSIPLLQGQELSEAGVKIGLLDKKVESADAECARQVAKEKEETQRIKDIMEEQERSVRSRKQRCPEIKSVHNLTLLLTCST